MWDQVARRQAGAISTSQLRAGGLTDPSIRHLVASGALERRMRGVFVARGAPLTYAHALWVAVLSTGGVLCFATAAHLRGIGDQPLRIHIALAPEDRSRVAGIRIHRVVVPESEIVQHSGLPVTSLRWTILDQLGVLPRSAAQQLADRALQRGWLRRDD